MKNKGSKHISINADPELHYKLHYICRYDGRSANKQLLYLIRQYIAKFEEMHGKIEINLNE